MAPPLAIVRRWAFQAYRRLLGRRLLEGGRWHSPDAAVELHVAPGVFHPGYFRSSRVLARFLSTRDFSGRSVLDLGCGTGILGIVCGRGGASSVTFADVDPVAVECARWNAAASGIASRTVARVSDGLAGVLGDAPFDAIVVNPPFYPVDPEGSFGRAFSAGDPSFLASLARDLPRALDPAGEMLVVLSSDVPLPHAAEPLGAAGLDLAMIERRPGLFETLTIYRAAPRLGPATRRPVN